MTILIPILSALLLSSCPGGPCPRPAVHASPSSPPPRYVRVADLPPTPADEPGYLPGTPMPTPPAVRQWVWLRRQGVWGFGWQRPDGLWVVDPGSKRKPAGGPPASSYGLSSRPAPSAGLAQAAPPDHRQAFLTFLNGHRAQHGLGPVGYSGDLEGWASVNNAQQRAMGMGHHVMGPARRQNAAMGTNDPAPMWVASAAHNSALLDGSITTIGLAFDGVYWTFNAR